jgi:outer membrane protein OmpA-like peptidoglycan-associated protein
MVYPGYVYSKPLEGKGSVLMRKAVMLTIVAVLLLATWSTAADLKGRTSVGLRAPFISPVFRGDDFSNARFAGRYQPFMMGWDFAAEVKRGISDHFMLGATVGYAWTYDDTLGTDNMGDELANTDHAFSKLTGILLGVNVEYYYDRVWIFQPYLLGGVGLDFWKVKPRADGDSYKSTDFNVKIGTGLLFPVKDDFGIDVQVKMTRELANLSEDFPVGFYGPDTWEKYKNRPFGGYLEFSIGLSYLFGGGKDADKDRVNDNKDKCPGTPQGARVDKVGCPTDADKDGVYDGLDKCPNTPAGAKVDAVGCPTDTDKDGVFDGLDKCPDTPTGIAVDANGCPFDADGDGVADNLDKCPNTVKGTKVDKAGCPIDSDKDGVPDGIDQCADTPAGMAVDKRGCPYDADADNVPDSVDKCLGTPRGVKVGADGCPLVKKITEKITLNIKFASGSFDPDQASKHQLDSIAERIMSYGDTKVEIRGYTDDRNTEESNLTLSQNRAKGVFDYLKSKGVSEDRMTAKGYGEDPNYFVADNKTAEGRAKNRRVEIESVNK